MERNAYSSSQTSQQEETNRNNRSKQSQPFHSSSLHSIRKPPSKPWKKPVAPPLPPAPTKVYKVEPINFREVVQKLTGAPEFALDDDDDDDDDDLVSQKKADERVTGNDMFQSRRLQSVAPPPLEVVNHSMSSNDFPAPLMLFSSQEEKMQTPLSAVYRNLMSENIDSTKPGWKLSSAASAESFPGWSPLGIGLSPSSRAWCSFPLLSPGTLSSLEQSTVL